MESALVVYTSSTLWSAPKISQQLVNTYPPTQTKKPKVSIWHISGHVNEGFVHDLLDERRELQPQSGENVPSNESEMRKLSVKEILKTQNNHQFEGTATRETCDAVQNLFGNIDVMNDQYKISVATDSEGNVGEKNVKMEHTDTGTSSDELHYTKHLRRATAEASRTVTQPDSLDYLSTWT